MGNETYISLASVAKRFCVSKATVRQWLIDGEIEGFKKRSVVRVDPESVEALIRRSQYYDVIRGVEPSAPSRSQRWRSL